jgi:hypothetical protein
MICFTCKKESPLAEHMVDDGAGGKRKHRLCPACRSKKPIRQTGGFFVCATCHEEKPFEAFKAANGKISKNCVVCRSEELSYLRQKEDEKKKKADAAFFQSFLSRKLEVEYEG